VRAYLELMLATGNRLGLYDVSCAFTLWSG